MKIVFSKHSLLKLDQRSISKDKALKTLRDPDYLFLSYSDRKAAYKKFGKLYLKVIFRRETETIIVITQYWDETFKPPTNL